ncbi:hypothetical protein EEL40_07185 [Muribaculaceae bacterium Isolate-083 (Janvier)]|nr:hypothetical protein EEL40_07185 [Muribaculaceae bacterium Isolate-083 (Janvier)]ROS98988.1 hypothetical protein EEL37_03505 [Muribaculaceae bacterium Isolate-077 (Janvier)]ROT01763.1 hypothetical protein EEL41_04010 [Muribaculaceae bacterium Isolate-084 (Janvier)]ROT02080.1 hypothetical protein EEL33_20025 [Muribaculaceae bacterium Isolate-037 (Harlan)]
MHLNDIRKELQVWILAEETAGRSVDINRVNEHLQEIMIRQNSAPRSDFNGLSPEDMHNIMYDPFRDQCVVQLNKLDKNQYELVPLIRQALFLLNTLNEKDLKLTKLGWLPLKIVADAYRIGQPEWIIEELKQKRINEYEVGAVWMARIILELLGWIKTRKGVLSLTVKGRKAFSNIDAAANEILRFSLVGVGLHTFDAVEDDRIGNLGIAYSVWLLNQFGSEWHFGSFYQEHYQKAFNFPDKYTIYETRVFSRLFYWLGIVEMRLNKQVGPPFQWEYRKTDLLPMIFSFK